MRVLFAICDPAQPSTDGSFWVWRAPDLSVAFLDSFYYDKASTFLPPDIGHLAATDVWGGASQHKQVWVGLCRYVNGGRDLRGRPGRFVLAVAFVQLKDAVGIDLSPLLTSRLFQWTAVQAVSNCPLPQPPALEDDLTLPGLRPDPVLVARLLREERVECRGEKAAQIALATCLGLTEDRQWKCSFQLTTQQMFAVVEYNSRTIAPPPTEDAFPNGKSTLASDSDRIPIGRSRRGAGRLSVLRGKKYSYSAVLGAFLLGIAVALVTEFASKSWQQSVTETESTWEGAPVAEVLEAPRPPTIDHRPIAEWLKSILPNAPHGEGGKITKEINQEVADPRVKPQAREENSEVNKPGESATIRSYPVSSDPRILPRLPFAIGGVLALGVVVCVRYYLRRRRRVDLQERSRD